MKTNKREILIIAGVEIAAGILESIVLPNLGKKDGFVLPDKMSIASSAAILTTTGVAAGFASNYIIERMNIGEDQRWKRVAIITAVAISFNVLEATVVDNVIHHHAAFEKWALPTMKKFASNLSVLVITGIAVGFLSDQLITATAPALQTITPSDVLADKKDLSVPEMQFIPN